MASLCTYIWEIPARRQAIIIGVLHDFPKFSNGNAVTVSGSDEVSFLIIVSSSDVSNYL